MGGGCVGGVGGGWRVDGWWEGGRGRGGGAVVVKGRQRHGWAAAYAEHEDRRRLLGPSLGEHAAQLFLAPGAVGTRPEALVREEDVARLAPRAFQKRAELVDNLLGAALVRHPLLGLAERGTHVLGHSATQRVG